LRDFRKRNSNIEFHENPSGGSRVVPCGRTDGKKDTTKLIVALMNLEFSWEIFEKETQISNFMKILPVEAKLFRADG